MLASDVCVARDPQRAQWWLAAIVPMLPWVAVAAYLFSGSEWVLWLGPLVLYGLVPLLDHGLGADARNAPEPVLQARADQGYYRAVLIAWIPLQYAALALGAWLVSVVELGMVGWLGLAATLGLVSGGGINIGHELGHKRGAVSKWLALLALAPAGYGHFLVEHNRGHHVRVATPEDPASARLGESFWRFLPRTVLGGLLSAWRLESQRLAKQGRPPWNWQNQNLQGWGLSLLFAVAAVAVFGWACLPLLLVQAAYGASTLEAVNYIEHYGLLRQRGADGRYERCRPEHSWNSNHQLTNRLLFQLQRHSDHHAHPLRPYQSLRHFDSAPQLPAGYAALVPLTYLPPLWFRLMDPRVLAHYGGDRSRANCLR